MSITSVWPFINKKCQTQEHSVLKTYLEVRQGVKRSISMSEDIEELSSDSKEKALNFLPNCVWGLVVVPKVASKIVQPSRARPLDIISTLRTTKTFVVLCFPSLCSCCPRPYFYYNRPFWHTSLLLGFKAMLCHCCFCLFLLETSCLNVCVSLKRSNM